MYFIFSVVFIKGVNRQPLQIDYVEDPIPGILA